VRREGKLTKCTVEVHEEAIIEFMHVLLEMARVRGVGLGANLICAWRGRGTWDGEVGERASLQTLLLKWWISSDVRGVKFRGSRIISMIEFRTVLAFVVSSL
jgi:hypothetical protein